MSDVQKPRNARRTTILIVVVLVAVIAVVAAVALMSSRAATTPASEPTSGAPGATTSTQAAPPSAASTPSRRTTPTAVPTKAGPTPQPTRTTTISSAAPIVRSLTAKVSRTQAVQGTASGPGEIAGPSLRFTITIRNDTGKRVSLANTVVNVYGGKAQTPAVELSGPGAKDFPSSVSNGSTATGVFVFNVPESQRDRVMVTVDTSVSNPVVAFEGAAP